MRWKLLLIMMLSFSLTLNAREVKPVKLPAPQLQTGKTLMQALKERKSQRSFSTKRLSPGVLSNVLWAACGINRPESGMRTAPSAKNWQEIDVYAACADGLYLYDAGGHALVPVAGEDIRALTGVQSFVKEAPVTLVFVADLTRMKGATAEEKTLYSAADTGFISQNVYLSCASEGLATVVRGSMDREALAKAMKLKQGQRIILAQALGYPKE